MDRKVLGKGLAALIPETQAQAHEKVVYLNIDLIKPNPYQPRQEFEPQPLQELTDSIRVKGIIQPIIVRRSAIGFELIAGERRLRAAKELKLEQIPAIVREASDEDSLEISLIENIQRQELNPIEEAEAYQHLMDKFSLTQEKISEMVGRSRPSVANILRLLKLPQEIKEQIKKGKISFAHSRCLLEIEDKKEQLQLAKKIIDKGLSVRELENLVQQKTGSARRKNQSLAHKQDLYTKALEEELQYRLATRVKIIKGKKGGHIQIEFYSPEDLERIMGVFKK